MKMLKKTAKNKNKVVVEFFDMQFFFNHSKFLTLYQYFIVVVWQSNEFPFIKKKT